MKMPFGKHKGVELEEIIQEHTGYFIWLSELDNLQDPLASEVKRLAKLKTTKECVKAHKMDQAQENDAYYDYIRMDREWQWK